MSTLAAIAFARSDGTQSRVAQDDEAAMIERAKADSRAFGPLYRAHYRAIVGAIYRRVGDGHAAEDLAAEVFLTAMRKLDTFEQRGVPLRCWLLRIAMRQVALWARRNKRRATTARLDNDRAADAPPSDREAAARARAALLTLPERHQAVLALHYLEGLDLRQVGATLGCGEKAVKSRLFRAREALRRRLEKEPDR